MPTRYNNDADWTQRYEESSLNQSDTSLHRWNVARENYGDIVTINEFIQEAKMNHKLELG